MTPPKSLTGNRWTEITARNAFPILVWCAQNGRTITYGQLDTEIVRRELGEPVVAVAYGHPAGAIGEALIELEKRWKSSIPPLNAIVINAKTNLPGRGVNYFLERYSQPGERVGNTDREEMLTIVGKVHADIFAYKYWNAVLEECNISPLLGKVKFDLQADSVADPVKGGWSNEPESEQHRKLKEYIAENPNSVGLSKHNRKGETEYIFASSDKADVVFETENSYLGVEVKSIISNDADLNRGLYQAVKYQALLRAEQMASSKPETARAVLVSEKQLPEELQNLAKILEIGVFIVEVNR